tara:strand:+ start:1174 stop:2403 length:1230 start_codon:yes stop_codon:yes gene_type:complete
MPKVVLQEIWEQQLRAQVKDLGRGWSVQKDRDKVRLKFRPKDQKGQTYTLESPKFTWEKSKAGDIYTRIRNIYYLVKKDQYSLKQADEITGGIAPKLIEQLDWESAKDNFKNQKINHGDTIKPTTWETKYESVLTDAVNLLIRGKVSNPEDLIDKCIEKWEPGSRTRQIRSQNLNQFLIHCVTREKFPPAWLLTTKLKDHIGKKPKGKKVIKACDISDQQIINLVNSFPDSELGNMWADAVRLVAEYGLRPVEIHYLSVKKDRKTGEEYFYCSYEKRSGGGSTEARELHPLPLVDDQGEVQHWNLLARWKAKDIKLPDLEKDPNAFKQYLKRNNFWKSLKAELAANDEHLRPYSFRNSYSLRGHLRNIDAGSMAEAMGHTLECHLREYPWASKKTTKSAFNKAMEKVAA